LAGELARELGKGAGKDVEVLVRGGKTEIDRKVAEALYHAERALERDPRFVFADMEAAECLCEMGRAGDLPADAAPICALPIAALKCWMNPVAGVPSR